jgi:hypothetical protein
MATDEARRLRTNAGRSLALVEPDNDVTVSAVHGRGVAGRQSRGRARAGCRFEAEILEGGFTGYGE